ncbi:MAG: OmpA family protein [Gemmatimonadota bacterium]|nr:OmpA family protein [Gemmatimonadota bacterium]MDE2983397.1 OmpA family protein [Gemmatimonadota bacterium]
MRQNFTLTRNKLNLTGFGTGIPLALALMVSAQAVTAQSLRMPTTLRYGSGLLDIPVASVLAHGAVSLSYSGFKLSTERTIMLDRAGRVAGHKDGTDKWLSDAALAIGLFNRVELGASIQHFDEEANGGNMFGGFARVSLLPASMQRFALAAGARYVTSPAYGAGFRDVQPGRLGHPDYRVLQSPDGGDEFSSNLSPYVVATANAVSSGSVDMTLTAGYGMGMFSAGTDLDFYSAGGPGGLFGGAGLHFALGGGRLMHLMAEYNGFEMNAGMQVDLGNVMVGAFSHGLNGDGESTYRSRKFGLQAAISFPNKQETVITADTMVAEDTSVVRNTVVTADTTTTDIPFPASDIATLEEMILFAFDRSEVTEEAAAALQNKVSILRADPSITLNIDGHADERGDDTYNVRLGQQRADAVLEFFTNAGLNTGRFTVASRGEEAPLDPRPTPIGTPSRNRRVDFNVTGYAERSETTITPIRTTIATTTITRTYTYTETETVLTTRLIGATDTVSQETRTVGTRTETVSVTTDTVGVERGEGAAQAGTFGVKSTDSAKLSAALQSRMRGPLHRTRSWFRNAMR